MSQRLTRINLRLFHAASQEFPLLHLRDSRTILAPVFLLALRAPCSPLCCQPGDPCCRCISIPHRKASPSAASLTALLAAGPGGLSSADLRRIPRGRLQARLRAPWRRSAAAEGRADIITSAGTAGTAGTAAAPHYRKWRRSRRK